MMRSLRGRLLAAIVATQVVMLILFGVGLYVLLDTEIRRDFDRVLTANAREIAGAVEQEKDQMAFEADPQAMVDYNRRPDALRHPDFFQVWLDDGSTLARSLSLGQGNLLGAPPEPRSEIRDIVLPDGRPGRMIVLPFKPVRETEGSEAVPASVPSREAVVAVARNTHQLEIVMMHMMFLLVGLGLAAAALSGAVLWLVTRRTFRPVDNLARQIAAIREEELDMRVGSDGVLSEFAPMVDKLNGLLARLHAAFARERGFSADVAHELRNPLAALQTTLEVCRSRPRDALAYQEAVDKSLILVERMERVVENLLLLSRAEARQIEIHLQPLHLNSMLTECWREVEPIAAGRRLTFQQQTQESFIVDSDIQKLRLILQNLLDNAVTYADEGGQIELTVVRDEGRAVVRLSNSGSRVCPEDVIHVCDRFWRADNARTDAGLHCGLGLAIVQRLTTLLGLDMVIAAEQNGWFRVELRIAITVTPNTLG